MICFHLIWLTFAYSANRSIFLSQPFINEAWSAQCIFVLFWKYILVFMILYYLNKVYSVRFKTIFI